MLSQLKTMLDISPDNTGLDAKLNILLENTTARLRNRLGGIEPPEDLEYIIVEVAIKRFNRIGSEGFSSQSVEGESLSFNGDDFEEFNEDIAEYLSKNSESGKGKLRFL